MMEQENNPEMSTAPDDKTVPSVGHLLREGRERMGFSVDDVVAKIKLAHRQIVALEENDFQALPETAFLRGFVRSYAKLLQMDAEPLLDALPGAEVAQIVPLQVEAPFPTAKSARRQNVNLLLAALLVALVIAGFSVWQGRAPHPVVQVTQPDAALVETPLPLPEQAEILDASGVPEAGVPESAVPVVVAAERTVAVSATVSTESAAVLRLAFDRESWAEIKDKYGKTLSRQVNSPGTELRVEGAAPFTLVIGHAAAVHLYYREKPVDLTSYINAGSDVARLTLE
jgi:cytoskeleton protein RodZ